MEQEKRTNKLVAGYWGRVLATWIVWLVVVGWGTFLLWQEWQGLGTLTYDNGMVPKVEVEQAEELRVSLQERLEVVEVQQGGRLEPFN